MKTRWGIAVITLAIIWAAVIIATSMVLKGTAESIQVLLILSGGAAATIILMGGIAARERRT